MRLYYSTESRLHKKLVQLFFDSRNKSGACSTWDHLFLLRLFVLVLLSFVTDAIYLAGCLFCETRYMGLVHTRGCLITFKLIPNKMKKSGLFCRPFRWCVDRPGILDCTWSYVFFEIHLQRDYNYCQPFPFTSNYCTSR